MNNICYIEDTIYNLIKLLYGYTILLIIASTDNKHLLSGKGV